MVFIIFQYVFFDHDSENTGSHFKMAVEDCHVNYRLCYYTKYFKNIFWDFVMAPTEPGLCNIGFVLENSKIYPTTSLKVEIEYVEDDSDYTKPKGIYVLYKVKNKKKIVKSWSFAFKFNRKHTEFKAVEFKRNGKSDYKLCYNMTTKWHRDHVITKSMITMGNDGFNETCPSKGSVIKISSKGEQSEGFKKLNNPEKLIYN